MASKLNPYINVLDGRARQAAEFYQSVLGGDLQVSTFGESGMEGPFADQVMHAQLETPAGYTLMVSDTPAEMMKLDMGNNISVSISGDAGQADELRGYFNGLAEGGTVNEPLAVAPWGAEFGMLTDRFGINWMVNIAADQA
ncbi:VOC family protein [Nocardioides daphniae]|uniref:VOC family protein n=1 Tax=Nocardioides daphniae TaxID=402297 RepID=A0A4V1CW61_9ACTN|nr:VOC family protein [Nocardioides daphniae]QCC76147.1 VOC family protein [Nocardioides daphniae]GGD09655.1 VOC family protein [Nocardioides daphniae]